MNKALLIENDPIASAALGEFSDPNLKGSFMASPIDGDTEKLQAASGESHYIAASMAIFNAAPNLREDAQLGVGVYVFEPEPNDEVKKTFVSTYGVIDLFKQAYRKVNTEMEPSEYEGLKNARKWLMQETTQSLASQKRRLIGGYAILASVAEPKAFSGFIFFARELAQPLQFAARDAALKRTLDMPEDLRRSRLVMNSDSEIEGSAIGTIIRTLLPLEKLEAALNGAIPE